MGSLILVMGEKGGVGKSFVAETLIEYLFSKGVPVEPWDSDRSNPFIYKRYEQLCKLAIFSEGIGFQDAANPLFLAAEQATVVCDTPAQLFPALSQWIEHNDLLTLSQEVGIHWRIVWPTDGQPESRALLQKTMRYFGKHAEFVIVLNNGVVKDPSKAWIDFEHDTSLRQVIQASRCHIIEFPILNGVEQLRVINQKNLTFTAALTHAEFDLIGRQRIKYFLRNAYAAFDEVPCLQSIWMSHEDKQRA
ncbi:hypothetical protein Lepto7375DRAFT_0075 [Leptolyngbya sp. PCC 7375]|nr:hypothetical protein Lepto7375DRAFT_0075 [Leptolyngbya sp. PCC 7375]